MNWFYNLKIGTKLLLSFVIITLIAGIIGLIGYSSISKAKILQDELYLDRLIPIRDLSQISINLQKQRGDLRAVMMYDDYKEKEKYLASAEKCEKNNDELVVKCAKTKMNKEEELEFGKFQTAYAKLKSVQSKLIDLVRNRKESESLVYVNSDEMRQSRSETTKSLDRLVEINTSEADLLDKHNDEASASAQLQLILIMIGGIVISILLGIFISRIISKPLKKGVEMFQEMQKGILSRRLHMTTKDEIGTLAATMDQFADDLQNIVVGTMKKISEGDLSSEIVTKDSRDEITPALKNTIESLRGLVTESKMLTKAAVEGKLSTRGNAEKFKGGYKEIVEGVNSTLDSVIGPLNVAAEYVDRISKGDIPKKITDNYNGDFNEIKNNLNNCIDAVNLLVSDAGVLSKAAVEGKLSTRADASKHQGDYRKIVEGVNATLDSVIGPLNVAAEYVDRISKGDIPKKITDNYNGDFNEIKNNLNNCIDNINALVADAGVLVKAAVEGKLSTRADASKHQGDYRKIVEGVNGTLDSVIGPLNVAAEYVDRISKGDIPKKITDNYNGDFNEIKNNLNNCIDNITALVHDADMLSKAAVEGKLSTRADASKHQGDYKKIVEGVNGTLDSVIGPLNVAAEYVDRISKGDIPKKITDTYNGDFNEIKNNLNNCIDNITALVTDAGILVKAAVEGKLSTRADASKHEGDYKKIVEGVNSTLDSVIGPLNVAAEYVDRISKGDIPKKITDTYNGDFNEIKNNLNNCIDNITALVHDADMLSKAAVDGKLSTRADASKHQGDYKKIVEGVNGTLDSVIGPLNVAAEYVDRISKGDIPKKISDTYNGDFNEIKNNLNNCIDNITALVTDAGMLVKAAVEGKLSTRADASKHEGDYKKIVEGVNSTLDSVIGPLNVAAEYVDKISRGDIPAKITDNYNGDFNVIKNNLNTCIDAVDRLVADAAMLTKAAVEGKLSTRADASKHEGDYRKIVEGVNGTLDSVIGPLNVAADYVDRISKGDIPAKITDNYNGDFNKIKNNLNTCIDAVNRLVTDAGMLAQAAIEGRLSTRADAGKHSGDFKKIVDGVNETLDKVIDPVNEAVGVIQKMAMGDLGGEITGDYQGDHATLKNAINGTLESLNDILSQVMTTVTQVMSGSHQVSDASQSLSQGATEQASSLEEITSSMTEIGAQTKLNAENANQANQLSQVARNSAEKGNKEMDQLMQAMNEITESSKNISKIIKVIDEIAFQTNLLALNAAVEAARAGRHGKGFAVVAEEVRNLAARSAKAAKETAEMIEGSIKRVENGSAIATRTSEALGDIQNGATKVTDIVGEIAASSNEQATSVSQVNTGLTQIDKVTQQNTANAEESASAAEELSGQANQLNEMIRRFKLRNGSMAKGGETVRQLSESTGKKHLPVNKEQKIKMATPKDIINLDDSEFGKF